MALGTRAVERYVEPGTVATCGRIENGPDPSGAGCGQAIKFRARHKGRIVLANVYEGAKWDRLVFFHAECYAQGGKPYGDTTPPARLHG